MSRKSKAAEFLNEEYNITVTGRNVEVTESMKDYAIEKISKLEKFTDRIIDVVITMDIQKLDHRVDLIVKFNNIKIRSEASSENMYTSIDQAAHKLQTQLLKCKTRLQDHHAKNLASVDMNVNVLSVALDEEINEEIERENQQRLIDSFRTNRVLSKETRALRVLTVDEAITRLELSGDRFLIFRSEEDQKLKVIYSRDDGCFGVIEVEA